MAAVDVAAAMAVAVVVAVVVAMWLVPKEEAVQAEAVAAKALEMSVAVAAAAAAMSVTVVAVAVAASMANVADVLLQARRQKCIRTTSGNRAGDRALITQQSDSIRLNRTQSTQVLTIVIRRTQSDSIDSGARDRDTRHAGIQARPETERSSTQQSDSIRLNRTQSDAINSTVVLVIVIREHAGNQARPKTERSSLSTQTRSDGLVIRSDSIRRSQTVS